MSKASLTRRIAFAAAHRYRRAEWDDARNEAVFGLCARASYHGHTYTCDVTVEGEIDAVTGFAVDLAALDRILAVEVRERFDHRNINTDVAEFAEDKLMPTGENLAQFVFERVSAALVRDASPARVVSVRIAEDATLSVEYRPG